MYRVFLADDDPLVLSEIKNIIDWEKNNCSIEGTASDGITALKRINWLQPDLVICDISLPCLSGLELLKLSVEKFPDTVFIILTNHEDFESAKESLNYRAVSYLKKSGLEGQVLEKALVRAITECENRKKLRCIEEKYYLTKKTYSEAIQRALQYIFLNVEKKITLNDVADFACISPGYLSTLFKQEVKQSLFDFINHTKIDHACELIYENKYRINEISNILGFENAFYFSRVFRKFTGVTPSEFRINTRDKMNKLSSG